MAPPRRTKNRGLERNLHTHPLGGYRYRKPDRSYVYVGHDKVAANAAARQANLIFAAKSTLVDKISSSHPAPATPFAGFIETFIKGRLARQEVSAQTLKNRGYELRKIAEHFGDKDIGEISTRDLHQYLEGRGSAWVKDASRARLLELFDVAIAQGLRTDNPARPLERANAKRGRARLDYEGFQAIRACAPNWLQNAMDLQLQTLQRPEDLVSMKWTQDTGSVLQLTVGKTGVRLAIKTSPKIREILNHCRGNIMSPLILHRRPEKLRSREQRSEKLEQLTRAFSKASDESGHYDQHPHPPSFYEIKSLGGSLYWQMGWTTQQVQALMKAQTRGDDRALSGGSHVTV